MQSPQSSKHPKSVLFIPTVCMTTPGPWAGLFGWCAYAITIDRARVDDGRGVTRARATIHSKIRGQSDCRITAARRWILTSHDPRISPPPHTSVGPDPPRGFSSPRAGVSSPFRQSSAHARARAHTRDAPRRRTRAHVFVAPDRVDPFARDRSIERARADSSDRDSSRGSVEFARVRRRDARVRRR